jgi:response regulator RpfG family c-di-GMP phosphodiesterase
MSKEYGTVTSTDFISAIVRLEAQGGRYNPQCPMQHDRIHSILLVEDEADDASFVRRALRKSNIANALIVRATADEASIQLGRVDGEPHPALAIIDIYLPGKESGLAFSHRSASARSVSRRGSSRRGRTRG